MSSVDLLSESPHFTNWKDLIFLLRGIATLWNAGNIESPVSGHSASLSLQLARIIILTAWRRFERLIANDIPLPLLYSTKYNIGATVILETSPKEYYAAEIRRCRLCTENTLYASDHCINNWLRCFGVASWGLTEWPVLNRSTFKFPCDPLPVRTRYSRGDLSLLLMDNKRPKRPYEWPVVF